MKGGKHYAGKRKLADKFVSVGSVGKFSRRFPKPLWLPLSLHLTFACSGHHPQIALIHRATIRPSPEIRKPLCPESPSPVSFDNKIIFPRRNCRRGPRYA